MSVASLNFLVFLLITMAVFFLCPIAYRWVILLVSSVVFYIIAGSWQFLPFIVLTSLVIWLAGIRIGKTYEELAEKLSAEGLDRSRKKTLKEQYRKRARSILILALVLCIGVLCVTKFSKYVVQYLNQLSLARGGSGSLGIAWLIVPLGISYYTFSTVGYLLDVYWKRYACEKNFFRFFLYAIYFPHIMQGPISRYSLLGQELKKELRFDGGRIVSGMQLMIWGFFKKLVIADRLNIFIKTVYDGQVHAGSIFLVTMVFDALMIYTDFSGYTDIVRGASQIFGVELENNFNHPFFSRSVPEFWRRWHMSLGGWFKDYVYYPVTVSSWMKKLNKRTMKGLSQRWSRMISVAVPCMITWFLTGLWHGTGINYVCWGIYYGILITGSVGFQSEFESLTRKLNIRTESRFWKIFQMVRTFCVFMGGRLLTSPGNLHNTKLAIKGILTNLQLWQLFDGSLEKYGLTGKELRLTGFCLVILWGVSMMQERFGIREKLAKQNIVVRWGLTYLGIFAVIIFGVYGLGYDAAAFVYQQY